MTDTWQDVPAAAPAQPADSGWQDVPAPEPVQGTGALTGTQGISDRLSKGFQPAGLQSYVLRKLPDIAADTAEFFHQGVSQTADAIMGDGPSQLEDARPEVERQLIAIGRTPEAAKQETDALMQSWRRQERMGGAIMGPLTALTAPLMGTYRALFSRPLEEAGGPPKEVTEMAGMVAGAVHGLPAMARTMARVKVTPDGKVTAQAVGELPKAEDFKTAAEIVPAEQGNQNSRLVQLVDRDIEVAKQSEAETQPERIASAAIKFRGQTFEAPSHFMAADKAEQYFGISGDQLIEEIKQQRDISNGLFADDGFVTTTGRYVDRVEANTVAEAAEQRNALARDNEGRLSAEELKRKPATSEELQAIRPAAEIYSRLKQQAQPDPNGKLDHVLNKIDLTKDGYRRFPYDFMNEIADRLNLKDVDAYFRAEEGLTKRQWRALSDLKLAAEREAANTEQNLRTLWDERGIHPAEALHDAQSDAFLKHELTQPPIEAFHGSPHEFTAFDISKVDTGEGAQVYGHGLYFAEHPDVAKSYAKKLSEGEGNIYRVKIHANPGHMIDFTKNLDEQSPFVLQAFERLRDTIKAESPLAQSGIMLDDLLGDKNKALQKVLDATKEMGAPTIVRMPLTFDDFYRQFAKYDFDQISAAEMMRDAGIPGIKYLDQASRDLGQISHDAEGGMWKVVYRKAGEQVERDFKTEVEAKTFAETQGQKTRNFVVFKDEDVQITHINDQPFYDQRFKQATDARDARIIQGLEEPPSFEPPPAPHPDRPLGEALRAADELRAANRDLPAQDRAILGELISAVRSAAAKRQLSVEYPEKTGPNVVNAFHGTSSELKGDFGKYSFFTDKKNVAEYFAEVNDTDAMFGGEAKGKVHDVKIDTSGFKEYDWPKFSKSHGGRGTNKIDSAIMDKLVDELSQSGSPGAIIRNVVEPGVTKAQQEPHTQYIVADWADQRQKGVVQQGDRFKKVPLTETAPAADAIAEHAWVEADQDLARAHAAMARIEEVKGRHPELAPTIDRAVQAVEDTLAQRDAMRPGRPGSLIKVEVTKNEGFRDSWRAENEFGWIGASVDPGKGLVEIQASNLRPGVPIGKGRGTELYKAIIDKGLDEGYVVESSRAVSEDARNLYEGLRRKGYTVETVNPEGMKGPRAPVYRITGGPEPRSLGAAATEAPLTPLSVQPPAPAGALMASAQEGIRTLFDIGRDIQMKVAPMATGTRDSILAAKDFANTMRKNRWEWSRIHDYLTKTFSPEQWKRMWDAADEESVLRQEGKTSGHMGLATLDPAERAIVDGLHARAENAWLRARDIGLVEGEGLPAYTPRMVINAAGAIAEQGSLPLNSIGTNLKASTARLMKRKYLTAEETEAAAKGKYGEQAELVHDIRTLPLAIAQLEDAIAGRTLVNEIKKAGKAGGSEAVAEGAIPKGSDQKWFTIDHPALKTWRPKFEEVDGKLQSVKDADGNVIFEQVPIYIRGDFEGPLRAVLDTKSGAAYQALMALKGKTTSVIMYTPAIHNLVELGRAFPAMPTRIFKAYFDGNRAKNDVAIMTEAIDSGLVPIGKRFFNQDISAITESPDLTPGRSWTAKVLAAVPGLFDEGAGTAVKRAVDKAGDFWHNTLLWDRIADLQMGLYTNLRGDLIGKGVDQATASIVAAHWANRYAGALPQEAMSSGARKVSNFFLFSRSFTMGNLGVMKDMLTGMPKDALAMIERAGGFKEGSINSAADIPQVGEFTRGLAMRKAMMIVALDIGLMYVGNSVAQSVFNVMLGDKTLDEEAHGYTRRFKEVLNKVEMHPTELLHPFEIAERLSATGENEPGRRDRIRIGYQSDGTAIYARNPVGKIGEEFIGYMNNPLEMLRKKEGTIARPLLQIFANDKGFGRKVYDPNAETYADKAAAIWATVEHFGKAQTPEGSINAVSDLVKGEGDPKTNALQAGMPFVGVTISKGAPGGLAAGEMYDYRQRHDVKVNMALPDIRKQILRGDVGGAMQRMRELDIPPGLQRFYIRTTLDPSTRVGGRTLRDFYMGATPEQRDRLERARQ